jgi:hypothetical protein
MARRRAKSKRRRSPKQFSILNAAEAYAYASILSAGVFGNSPWGFITDQSDIAQSTDTSLMAYTGANSLSLTELVTHPDVAFGQMQSNVMSNYQAMAVASITTGVGFKLFKKLMRRPISNVNRNIMKPLGVGIKL